MVNHGTLWWLVFLLVFVFQSFCPWALLENVAVNQQYSHVLLQISFALFALRSYQIRKTLRERVRLKLLTLFPPKTYIFVHSKNCTFSKKGLGHKGRCYSVCNDDTCKWTSHILSRIIGPSNTATKIGMPISDTGHMAQISTANPEILINFHACSCKVYSCSCKIYSCSRKIHAFPCKFMRIHAKFICVHVNFFCVHVNFMHGYLKYQL